MTRLRSLFVALLAAPGASCMVTRAPMSALPVSIKIEAFNDLHGSLQSPGSLAYAVGEQPVAVGGADYLAAYIAERVSHNANHVVVSAGDLVGASPLISAAYHDEGTIEAMNLLGLDVSVVGNHEFDAGTTELLRKQTGGCLQPPAYSCLENGAFPGASFKYLAANVVVNSSGRTLFPAYEIKTFSDMEIAFIGVVLRETPSIVLPKGVAGLTFADEADTVNALIPELRTRHVNAIVLVVHQGATPNTTAIPNGTTINNCAGILGDSGSSAILGILSRLRDEVDLVISAHTHVAYNCRMKNSVGRAITVTQASAFGRVLTDIDMSIDPTTGQVTNVAATNVLVSQPDADSMTSPVHAFLSSPQVVGIRRLIADYSNAVAPVANQPIGAIAAPLPSAPNASGSGEELAGDLVADSQLAATAPADVGGAEISFINGSGVRNPGFNLPNVPYPHDVTYQEAFNVRPFGNSLVTMTLSAQQIRDALEQQFAGCNGQTGDNILEVSEGFHVDWSSSAAPCNKIVNVTLRSNSRGGVPDRIVVSGVVQNPNKTYRVSMDNFLAAGKSNFTVFPQGKNLAGGPRDIDAIVSYMKSKYMSPNKPYDPADPTLGIPRISKLN